MWHLPQTQATYPKPRNKHSDLCNVLPLNVCPLHLTVVERAIYIQVLLFSPLPAPRHISKSLNVQECLVLIFFFYPGVVLGREETSDPAGTVRRRREGGPGGSGAERAADPRRPPPCPASAAGSGGAHPAAAPVFTAHYFCHLASTSFQVVCRCFANFAAALSPGKRERGGKHHFVWGLLSEWGGGGRG